MLNTVSRVYDSLQSAVFPSADVGEAKTEMHETVVALLASIFAADGKLKQSESDFLNAFLSTRSSLSENVKVLRSYLSKSPDPLTRVPRFVKQVAQFDKDSGSPYAAMLVDQFDKIGGAASLVDGEQQVAEQEALASYLARLDAFLVEEGVQPSTPIPGRTQRLQRRIQLLREKQGLGISSSVAIPGPAKQLWLGSSLKPTVR